MDSEANPAKIGLSVGRQALTIAREAAIRVQYDVRAMYCEITFVGLPLLNWPLLNSNPKITCKVTYKLGRIPACGEEASHFG